MLRTKVRSEYKIVKVTTYYPSGESVVYHVYTKDYIKILGIKFSVLGWFLHKMNYHDIETAKYHGEILTALTTEERVV